MNIVKGMSVKVISGNHRGKEGKVLYVFPKKNRIIVEGINIIKKHANRKTTYNTHIMDMIAAARERVQFIGYHLFEISKKLSL